MTTVRLSTLKLTFAVVLYTIGAMFAIVIFEAAFKTWNSEESLEELWFSSPLLVMVIEYVPTPKPASAVLRLV